MGRRFEKLFCMYRSLSLFDFNEPIAAKLGLEHRLIAAGPVQNICPPTFRASLKNSLAIASLESGDGFAGRG